MSDKLQLFARLTKIDEATRKVYGRATQEVADRSGEIMDYELSKPNFQKWSSEMAKATDGKSVGNVRSMHGKTASGKLTEIVFQDMEKAIDVCAEIVDDQDWKKCLAGVYTGFSVGGSYGKKWTDEQGLRRYVAEPCEVSLVDLPCVPTASFSLVKADGTTADVALVGDPEANAVDELAKLLDGGTVKPSAVLELLRKQADEAAKNAHVAAVEALKAAVSDEALEKITNGDVETLAATHMAPSDFASLPEPGPVRMGAALVALRKLAGFEELGKVAERDDVSPKEGEDKYGDVKFADAKNKKYPIDTEAHIRAAWNYINKPANAGKYSSEDVASIKAKIVSAWKAKIDKDGPPSADEKSEKVFHAALRKGLYTVAQLAQMVEALWFLQDSVEAEQKFEQDADSELPARLQAACVELGEILCMMAEEETSEEADAAEKAVFVDQVRGLAKVGARNSAADQARLQGIHDHSVKMGAVCDGGAEADKVASAGALAKAFGFTGEDAETRALAELSTLQKQAKLWRDMPAIPRGSLRAVPKTADGDGAELEKSAQEQARDDEIKRAEESGDPQALVKAVFKYGGVATGGSTALRK